MASKIQRVASLALRTFTNVTSRESFQENLHTLRASLHQVQSKDLNLDPSLVNSIGEYHDEVNESGERVAPVTYLHLYEDHVFTMGIFVLKHGVRLPLHDHPGMYGIIKVIHGKAAITSYNQLHDRPVPDEITRHLLPHERNFISSVEKNPPQTVTPLSPPCMLAPEDSNFHEISAPEGPLAFVDILAPPYDRDLGMRQCHYYKELVFTPTTKSSPRPSTHPSSNEHRINAMDVTQGPSAGSQVSHFLIRVPQPREFWCDATEYQGPEINPYEDLT